MLYELRKICEELHVKILILVVLIISFVVAFIPIGSFSALESAENSNLVKGKAAISLEKERYENIKGILSIQKINEALNYYQSISTEDLAYVQSEIKYPGIINMLVDAYSSINEGNNINLYKLKNADDFYDRYKIQINEQLNHKVDGYDKREKEEVLEKAGDIDIPFQLDYSKQWQFSYRVLTIVFIGMAVVALMVGIRLFSYEKEKNMDLILATIDKRNLYKIGRNKIFAFLLLLTLLFGSSIIIFSMIFFSITGFRGWNSQIQTTYFYSIYNLTFSEAYLLFVFMGWVCILTIGMIIATINAFTQKSYNTLVIGTIIIFIPFVITRLGTIPLVVKKFFRLQPINGFMTEKILSSMHMHKLFFINISTATAIIFYAIFISIVCMLAIPKIFSIRINKG